MHIDQRRETAPSAPSGKPKRRRRKGTPVVCLDTQTTFPSVRAASAWAGCSVKCIGHCVAGRTKTAGGYRWAWADASGRRGRTPVVCIETGERFDSVKAAAARACCAPVTLSACLACGRKTAGDRHWAYAEQPPESWRAAIECPEAGAEFESLGAAAEWAGCAAAEIADCLAGKRPEAGGLHWRFRKLRGGRLSKPIVCVETGAEFPSIRAAEERTGCCHGTISAVLSGRSKTAGGYRWAYADRHDPSWKTPVICLDTQTRFPGVKEAAAWAGCNPGSRRGCRNDRRRATSL